MTDATEEVMRRTRERIAREQAKPLVQRRSCRRCGGCGKVFKRERGRWVDYPCEECQP